MRIVRAKPVAKLLEGKERVLRRVLSVAWMVVGGSFS